MLRSVKNLSGFKVSATDGKLGKVEQFYFDDESWTVRYLVINTGFWIFGRKVLVSPIFFTGVDWLTKSIALHLSKKQIRESPDVDTAKPVSRIWETEYYRYYNVPVYWSGPEAWGTAAFPQMASPFVPPSVMSRDQAASPEEAELKERAGRVETHLRSSKEVLGYRIAARDGDIGHVDDFVVDDASWRLRYLVVDTARFLSGKKVIVSPLWIEEVVWPQRKVTLGLSKASVESCPEFDLYAEITRDYEAALFAHYGKDEYWQA
jgi:hypothetical protein